MGWPLEGNCRDGWAWAHASSNWSEPRSDAGRLSDHGSSAPAPTPRPRLPTPRPAACRGLGFSAREAESGEPQPQASPSARPAGRRRLGWSRPGRRSVPAQGPTLGAPLARFQRATGRGKPECKGGGSGFSLPLSFLTLIHNFGCLGCQFLLFLTLPINRK